MLNTFPELLTFGILAPFLLRVMLALMLIEFSLVTHKKRASFTSFFQSKKLPWANVFVWKMILLQFISGIFLLIGMYTQINALIAIYSLLLLWLVNSKQKIFILDTAVYIMLIMISISLLLTGAGAFAFDYPL